MKYIILIKTDKGQLLTFLTQSYKKENGFIEFADKNGKYKMFSLEQLKEVSEVE